MRKGFLLAALFILWASSVGAVDYYISPTGSDSNSCVQAQNPATPRRHFNDSKNGANDGGFSCMSAGDHLILRGGTYDEGHAIDMNGDTFTPGIPSGTSNSNRTEIRVYPGETARIQPSSNPSFAGVMVFLAGSTKQYITIDGGTKCGRGTNGTCRLILDGTIIQNGAIFYNGGASNIRVTGVEMLQTATVNCGGVDCGTTAVQGGGVNWEIRDSNVHHTGIVTNGAPTTTGGYCVYTAGNAAGQVIDNNLIHHCGGFGIHQNSQNDFPGPSGMVLSNNDIYGNGQSATQEVAGAIMRFCSNCQVFNNLIHDQVGVSSGLQVGPANSGTTRVYNNTITRNPRAGLIIDYQSSGAFDVENNILKDNNLSATGRLNIEEANGTGGTYATNLCNGTGGTAHCSVTSDPRFADAANSDFRLCTAAGAPNAGCVGASPAIDAGSTLGAPWNLDIVGTARPQGVAFDIGAYESGATPTCPAPSPALVAQYSADNVATDSSGNANHGTLNGVGSGVGYNASGKYGQAFSFAGAGAVTVADANSLDMCSGFTLAAWVKPSNTPTDYVGVIHKDNKYRLYSAADPAFCTNSGPWTGYSQAPNGLACYATALPANVWTYLTATYDYTLPSANLKVYLNGSLVTSGNGTAALDATTGLLYIGGSNFGEYFTGLIDEIRVYNYARSPAQIVTDMNTPINPIAPATIRVSIGAGNGTLKLGAATGALKVQGQ